MGTAANRRSRKGEGKIEPGKPQCCREAWPKMRCAQHQEEEPPWRMKSYFEDYSGALPRPKHSTQPGMPSPQALDNAETVEEEFALLSQALSYREIAGGGLGVKGERAALDMPPMGQWVREDYPVIGQTDLDAQWNPVNPSWRAEFGERAYVKRRYQEWATLVRRGPAWPWAIETEMEAAA